MVLSLLTAASGIRAPLLGNRHGLTNGVIGPADLSYRFQVGIGYQL
jgi:hypothetical protein